MFSFSVTELPITGDPNNKMNNRRSFLKLTCAAAFGGLLLGESIISLGQRKENFPLPETILSDGAFSFSRQTFEPLVDTIFVFKSDDEPALSMKLIEVATKDETKKYASDIPTDDFALIFENQGKIAAEDKIYQVAHSALGDFSMFVSTVGKSGRRYQAIFNRVYF